MQEIKLKSIKITGFGSISGEMVFKLDRPGFNIIQARNGSGKTSILSALCWAGWGQTIKKGSSVTTWQRVQPEGYNGTKVELTLIKSGVRYTIVRCKDYKDNVEGPNVKGESGLYIFKKGKYQPQFRDKADAKAEAQRIMGFPFEVFKNSVVFGQKVSRIITQSGPEQKEILEQAFEVGYINKAHELEKKKLVDLNKQFTDITLHKSELKTKLTNLKEVIALIRQQRDDFEKNREIRLQDLRNQRLQIENDLQSAKEELKAAKKINEDILVLESKLAKYEQYENKAKLLEDRGFRQNNKVMMLEADQAKIEKEKEIIRNQIASKDKVCIHCGQTIEKSKIKAHREKLKDDYNNADERLDSTTQELMHYQEEYRRTIDKLAKYRTKSKDAISIRRTIKNLQTDTSNPMSLRMRIKTLETRVKTIIGAMALIDTEKNDKDPGPKIQERELLKEAYMVTRNTWKKLKAEVNLSRWLVDDALSNKGLKAYIFASMLDAVNLRLKHYSKYVGFRAKVNIDLKSARKDVKIKIYSHEHEVNVADLSGGQAQLIDIIIAFSLYDVVSTDKICNLLFMDEVFESLDEENVELVTQLIMNKAKGKSLFLITHLQNFNVTGSNLIRLALNKDEQTILMQ